MIDRLTCLCSLQIYNRWLLKHWYVAKKQQFLWEEGTEAEIRFNLQAKRVVKLLLLGGKKKNKKSKFEISQFGNGQMSNFSIGNKVCSVNYENEQAASGLILRTLCSYRMDKQIQSLAVAFTNCSVSSCHQGNHKCGKFWLNSLNMLVCAKKSAC